jgi:hypothetical protein
MEDKAKLRPDPTKLCLIHRIFSKYLARALPPKRLKTINPVHSFRAPLVVKESVRW